MKDKALYPQEASSTEDEVLVVAEEKVNVRSACNLYSTNDHSAFMPLIWPN